MCGQTKKILRSQASIFNPFATFLLLSFSKILFTSINSIYQVNVNPLHHGTKFSALYYNPYEPSAVHLPYFIPVITLIVITTLFPILVFCLYPIKCIRKVMYFISCKDLRCIQSFVDPFQGYYKDGTNGTRDYRALASLQFIARGVFIYNQAHFQASLPILSHMKIDIMLLICLSVYCFAIQTELHEY